MAAEKRIFLITGANCGIGCETSYTLANASPSHHVVITARSSPKGAKSLDELRKRKLDGTLSFLEPDISLDASIAAAAKTIVTDFGKLDVLINNAGITESVRIGESERPTLDQDALRRVFEANAFGSLLLAQAFEPLLRKSPEPRIINVSSSLGSVTLRSRHERQSAGVMYDADRMSKFALNMMAMCFR